MSVKLFPSGLVLLLLISCSLNKTIRDDQLSNLSASKENYFPGVDSVVVNSAYKIADRIFVDLERRNQAAVWHNNARKSFQTADSLLDCYKHKVCQDSIIQKFYFSWQHANNQDLNKFDKYNGDRNIRPEELLIRIFSLAEKDANHARRINPYDLDIRSLLVNIYSRMGELSGNLTYYSAAIEELKNLLLVDKSNPYVYERLAECYYALKDWENCYFYFDSAEQILHIVSRLNNHNNHASIDTARWVYYLQGKGEAKAKLYDSGLAITYLTMAKQMTGSAVKAQQLQNYLNWIKWDDGNLRASELRDEAQRIEQAGDYKKAHNKYLELLNMLTTQRAKNEIDWKSASIEFNFLGQKLAAIQRMYRVVQNIQKSGAVHELNAVYLQDYAAMCYSIGIDCYHQHKYRLAYIYINQAAQFEWKHRADCFLQLAILSEVNPSENIRNCLKAMVYSAQLSEENLRKIKNMLTVSYIRMGDFDMAQNYYQKIQQSESSLNN